MRIGVLCPYSFDRPGGVQNHVLGLSSWLIGEGHQVGILGPGRPSAGVLAHHSLDSEVITSAGRAWPIPVNGSVARVNYGPHVARRVVRWLASGDFDLVHLQEPIMPTAAQHALRRAKVPVVATFHATTRACWRAGSLVRQGVAYEDVCGLLWQLPGDGAVTGAGRAVLAGRSGSRRGEMDVGEHALGVLDHARQRAIGSAHLVRGATVDD